MDYVVLNRIVNIVWGKTIKVWLSLSNESKVLLIFLREEAAPMLSSFNIVSHDAY